MFEEQNTGRSEKEVAAGVKELTEESAGSCPHPEPTGKPDGTRLPGRRRQEHVKRKRYVAAVAILAIGCLAGAGSGVYLSRQATAPRAKGGLVYEANIVSGDLPGKSGEERQRELDSIVEEGMLAMSMNITPSGTVSGKGRAINWLIENPSNQGKLIRVEVTRDDTGEKIYETGAIPPGNYVESAPLDVPLPPGQYACTAVFFAYREESEELMGQAAVELILTIQE